MFAFLRRARSFVTDGGLRPLISSALARVTKRARVLLSRRRGERVVTVGGTSATFDTSGRFANVLQYFLDSEREMIDDMVEEARPDDIFWDVGAHIGFHATLVGLRVEQTVAFEPIPHTAETLTKHLKRNEVDASVETIALSNFEGTITLDSDSSPGIDSEEELSRPVRTGNELVESGECPRPSLMKVDVEGAEGAVLEGASDLLEDCRAIYVEIHRPAAGRSSVQDFGYTEASVVELLEDANHEVEVLADRGDELHVKAHS